MLFFFFFLPFGRQLSSVCVVFIRRLETVPVPSKVIINFVKELKSSAFLESLHSERCERTDFHDIFRETHWFLQQFNRGFDLASS